MNNDRTKFPLIADEVDANVIYMCLDQLLSWNVGLDLEPQILW